MSWARRLLRELRGKEPEDLLQRRGSYADVAFLPIFLEWVDELVFHDPRAGLKWAKVAPELALATPKEDGRQAYRDRVVKAWAVLGSAYRAVRDHDASDESYREALKLAAADSVSELVRADTDRRLSTLRACQGRADEALDLASGAVMKVRQAGAAVDLDDDEKTALARLLARALISRGNVLFNLHRYGEAIDAFGEALTLAGIKRKRRSPADRRADRRLHASSANNLALTISESPNFGDHRKAMLYLRQARELVKGQKRSVALYRVLWVEGLIWSTLGSHARAEKLFRQALEGFQTLRLPWETALVALDLGELLRLCGEWAELKELADETFQRFRLLSGDTQALTALSQWADAVRARSLADEQFHATRQIIAAGVFTGHRCKRRR